jgi:hypothetical protein
MSYPNTYEFIDPISFEDCVLYSHKLEDGFLDDDRDYEVSNIHNIYVKHLSPNPLLSIYDDSGTLIAGDLTGTYIADLQIHKFGLDLTSWTQTGKFLFKLHSTDYPVIFTKVVHFVDCSVCSSLNTANMGIDSIIATTMSNSSTLLQVVNRLEELKDINNTNAENSETLITSSGRKVRVVY